MKAKDILVKNIVAADPNWEIENVLGAFEEPENKTEELIHLRKLLHVVLESMEEYKNQWCNFLTAIEKERLKWSLETFPEATAVSSLTKLLEEVEEIKKEIEMEQSFTTKDNIATEYADALMCLFDSAGRHGITTDEITSAYAVKFAKNKNRKWVKNPDNTYSHIK